MFNQELRLLISYQIAWALNKGIKAEFKQYWDVEMGVTYVPWSKIREDHLEELKEGGTLDVDTLSPGKNPQTGNYKIDLKNKIQPHRPGRMSRQPC